MRCFFSIVIICLFPLVCSAEKDWKEILREVRAEKSDAEKPETEMTPAPIPTPEPEPSSIILAKVNNRILTKAEVNRILEKMLENEKGGEEHLERIRFVYKQNILQEWVERALLAEEAEREGLTVSDKELKEQEDALKKAADVKFDINGALDMIGATKDEYRKELRDALLGEKLVRRRISAYYSEKALREIYNQNKKAFIRPPRVRADHVFCLLTFNESDEEKDRKYDFMKDARKEAKRGKDLKKAASKADPKWKCVGGDLGWLYPTNRLPEPLNSLVFKLDVGDVSKIIETSHGFYILRINEKQPQHGNNYNEARQAVKDAVFEQVREKVLDIARRGHEVIINISGIPADKL